MKIRDSVVVSASTAIQNGVIISIDFLENQVFHDARFSTTSSNVFFDFTTCKDAPFLTDYWVKNEFNLVRKNVNRHGMVQIRRLPQDLYLVQRRNFSNRISKKC
ncbi:MAG: hypothetical protein ACI8PB_003845 [Desulforhopalus sp.]